MALYRELDTFAEITDTLTRLKAASIKTAILSNGSPDMLNAAAVASGIDVLLDAVLSVEDVGTYKPVPRPRTHQPAVDRLDVAAGNICFMSSNGWDAAGAGTFGFRVVWVNRYGQPAEHLPAKPDLILETLTPLPTVLGLFWK